MFQVEILSGGIFTVYAVDSYANLFLIYKDDAWQWIEMNHCKLYYAGALAKAETTQIIDGCCTACGELMDCCEAAEYKFCPYCAKRIV